MKVEIPKLTTFDEYGTVINYIIPSF